MKPLTARTTELDEEVDILHLVGEDGTLFESSDQAIAGSGQAARLEIEIENEDLNGALAKIAGALRSFDAPDAEPIAFVSVPFASSNPVVAIVPEVMVRQEGIGTATVTTIGDVQFSAARIDNRSSLESPHSFSLRPSRSPKEWCDAVDEAIRRLKNGDLQKVAMAREVVIEADAPFSQVAALRQLRRSYPTAYRYAFEGFVGASPELLIERVDREIRSEMLAGTAPRSSDAVADEALRTSLLRSAKDRAEHRYLAEMVAETLEPLTSELTIPSIPQIMSLANVHHLATPVHGTLASNSITVLDLVAALHPTPAVGGRPTTDAVKLIEELEELDRGKYAGAIGWVDSHGNGRFAIALRCAQLQGETARLYAGNGIVAASHPQRELEETQWKMQAMLSALVRP